MRNMERSPKGGRTIAIIGHKTREKIARIKENGRQEKSG